MGTQNKLKDLNNHLFMQLERLNDEEITGEQLQEEIGRAKAVAEISTRILGVGQLAIQATKINQEYGKSTKELPLLSGVADE